jgi:tetratricopeptide (TPR) repeat protein
MADSWQDSVVLITSSAHENKVYGTGFVVHRDEQGTYILTCTHVIDGVGGKELIHVNDIPAQVIAASPADDADIAVLRLTGLADKPLLRPYINNNLAGSFELAGYYHLNDNPKKPLVRQRLYGFFDDSIQTGMTVNTLVPFWEIEITSNGELRAGNSGSPVVDEHNYVIGIVTTYITSNKKRGWVTPIESLKKIWTDLPPDLFIERIVGTTNNTRYEHHADPNSAPTYIGKGAALRSLKRYNEALAAYEQAIRLDPKSAHAHIGKGNALTELKRYDEALTAYEQAIQLAPYSSTAYRKKGHTLNILKRHQEAAEAYQQAQELEQNDATG